jgi:hypothetical protein
MRRPFCPLGVCGARESVANDQRDDRARRLRALGEVVADLLARSHRGEP